MEEQWKSIPDFPDYEVSNTGLVRSFKLRGGGRRRVPHILKPGKHTGGYHTVQLRRNGKTHVFRVGLLVLLAFRGPCPEGCEMCHNDSEPANDHLDNLRWDTHLSNMRDAARRGLVGRPKSKKPKAPKIPKVRTPAHKPAPKKQRVPKVHVPTEREILTGKVKAMRAKMIDAISFGQRIKILRAIRDLNQGELAEKLGMPQVMLSYYENDHALPSPKRTLAIMNELGWSEQLEPAFAILAKDGAEGSEP